MTEFNISLLQHLREWEYHYEDHKTAYQYIKAIKYSNDSDSVVELEFMSKFHTLLKRHLRMSNHSTLLGKIQTFLNLDHNPFEVCRDCQDIAYEEDMRCCYEEYYVCEGCADNYVFSEYRDCYISEDDYYEEESEQEREREMEDEFIHTYDYNVMDDLSLTSLPNERIELNTAYYGVELEVERRKNCPDDIAERIHNLMHRYTPFALLKSDGSLSNGFEIVSAPATLNAHKFYWKPFFDSNETDYLKSWNTDTTGLHIHISRSALSQSNIGKILVFINDEKNQDFINHIAGRNSNQWAKKSPKKITDGMRLDTDKYEAVNTSHQNSIELRIFRGNLSRIGFFRVLEFVDCLVNFVKNNPPSKLYYTDFVKWCELPQNRSSYPYFYGWLTRKSYCKGKPTRKIDWTNGLAIEKKNIA